MLRVSRLKLPPLNLGTETIGQRILRLRKERGFAQVELAAKLGLVPALVCDYEHDRLRLHAEMVIRFAKALGVTTDELLLSRKVSTKTGEDIPLRFLKRIRGIKSLPPSEQKALLKTLDVFLRGPQQNGRRDEPDLARRDPANGKRHGRENGDKRA